MTTHGWTFGVSDVINLPSSQGTGYVLAPDGAGGLTWIATSSIGVTDHGALTGLGDDDHTQYLLATGARDGGTNQMQRFTWGVISPLWRADVDGTASMKMLDASATTAIMTVDTVNYSIGVNSVPLSFASMRVARTVSVSTNATGLYIESIRQNHTFPIGTKNVLGVDIFTYTSAINSNAKTSTQGGFQITNTVQADATLTATVTTLTSVKVNTPVIVGAGTKTVTTSRGFWISNQGHANIANTYAVYIDQQTGAGTASYAIYSLGGQSQLWAGAATTNPLMLKGASSQSANLLEVQNSSANVLAYIGPTGGIVANEQGENADSRIEGDTDPDLTFWDASTDRVGIGTATPASKLHVLASVANTSSTAQVLTTTTNSTGTPAANFGGAWLWNLETDTTDDTAAASFAVSWATATHASRKARMDFSPFDTVARLALRLGTDGSAPMIGFFGGTEAIQQVLAAYTSDPEGSAYTGIDNLQVGTVYAQLADLNTLRVAYDNLRASYDDLRSKLLTSTLVA